MTLQGSVLWSIWMVAPAGRQVRLGGGKAGTKKVKGSKVRPKGRATANEQLETKKSECGGGPGGANPRIKRQEVKEISEKEQERCSREGLGTE